ncbi:MAG: phosphatidate cytidylyltransferase [Candidatus Saccharimonadales bacterium]
MRSKLFIKILIWIPLFIIFVTILYFGGGFALLVLLVILAMSIVEFISKVRYSNDKTYLSAFLLLYLIGLFYSIVLYHVSGLVFYKYLVIICFATVLSDVCAFFFGSYFGKHPLPKYINEKKSIEGIVGQIVGAFVGVLVVHLFIFKVSPFWIFIPIGIGSAIGDIGNSAAKRRAQIGSWSEFIPGHGGFIDRFASFSGSFVLVYISLNISGILR